MGEEICSISVEREFLTYFSISYKSEFKEMLLVVMTIPLSSTQIKSTIILELIPLRAHLMLITCMLESLMNFLLRLLLIGMITCLRDGPFVVILILGLDLELEPLMTFWIRSIFAFRRLGNDSLIFNIFLVILDIGVEEEVLVFLDKDDA